MRLASTVGVLTSLAAVCQSTPLNKADTTCLPVVDLGYELHQALEYNATSDVYTFQNIRYGRNPTGDLRWRAPLPPLTNRTAIQTGFETRICPQGLPGWQTRASGVIKEFAAKDTFNLTTWEEAIANSTPAVVHLPGTTEDCLFLDVHVPREVMQKKRRGHYRDDGVPVLVFIHGGGYTLGSKLGFPGHDFYPSGIMDRAAEEHEDGLIFISLNYRLGAFGFLAGPEVEKNGDLNAGLLDQKLALEWVQKYIHLFGGSPKKVTAMGESAGGGSILLHMAANGGTPGGSLFAQAIPQSPAILPTMIPVESALDDLLALLNVTTLDQARLVPSDVVINANAEQIGNTPATSYNYFPVIDGKYITEPAFSLIARGDIDKSVKVMTGHNSFEGGFFYDPTVKTEQDFQSWIRRSLTGLTDSQIENLANELYPPQFDGSLGYVDQATRQGAVWGEAVLDCLYEVTNEVFGTNSYSYEFSVVPGVHTQDLAYTFSERNGTVPFPKARDALQQAIASFAMTGTPTFNDNGKTQPFPRYGAHESIVVIGGTETNVGQNNVNKTRCTWWKEYHNAN